MKTKTAGIVNGLIQANETGNAAIRDNRVQMKDENRETIEQLLDDIKKEKVRLQLERLQTHKPSKSTTTSSDDRAFHDATIIKNTLSPYTSIVSGLRMIYINMNIHLKVVPGRGIIPNCKYIGVSRLPVQKVGRESVCRYPRDTGQVGKEMGVFVGQAAYSNTARHTESSRWH